MKKRQSSSIVTISSVNALFGFGETAYTAAKGGLISMMRLVAAEYGEWNIRSNVICPGTIETPTSMNHWKKYPSGYARLLEMYPLGRIGQPIEVAQYALFLASEESAFVNGSVCVIDGGLLAGRKFEVR
jgi:3-oxoacyl-[acyl-carrier protein] reductase